MPLVVFLVDLWEKPHILDRKITVFNTYKPPLLLQDDLLYF